MTRIAEIKGADEIVSGDFRIKGGKQGIIPRLARKMIGAGEDDGPLRVLRDGAAVFAHDFPLSWWAGKAVSETDRASVRFVKYAPHPLSGDAQ